jgi:3-oxoacyl-ACP reductase-like protein
MKAVRIPTTGSAEVIDLIAPVDGDATAFLASLYAATCGKSACLCHVPCQIGTCQDFLDTELSVVL